MALRQRAHTLPSRLAQTASILALLVVSLHPGAAQAGISSLSQLFVFGDSLSDGGNAGSLSSGSFPPSPYVGNRVSNGPVAVEYLWQKFNPGNSSFRPSLQGGSNYAIAGSTTGKENNLEVGNVPGPPLNGNFANKGNAWQLNSFSTNTSFDSSTSLFAIWLFPNDIFYFNNSPLLSAGTYDGNDGTPTTFEQIPSLAVDNIVGSIQELASRGAIHFLVANSPDLSKVPAFLGKPSAADMGNISLQFNNSLETAIASLRSTNPQLDITIFRVDQTLNDIIANPGAHGITNVSDACYNNSSVCATPSTYLFWDQLHPTTRAHSLLATGMYNAVPGPLPLLGGLAAFGWSRQLRQRQRLKGTSKNSASSSPAGAGLPQGQVEVPQMELKNADRPGWAQMTTGLPMNRRPDPQPPQDFWSALPPGVKSLAVSDLAGQSRQAKK
ncbi:MAG: SGNH/GDSL hydrolase family protein [Cyanobacteriota bacterium]